MKKHPFEINVAFIGYVSVGKTTLLNALFREQYSEVSMKRTTAAVNKFRISFRENEGKRSDDKEATTVDSKEPDKAADDEKELTKGAAEQTDKKEETTKEDSEEAEKGIESVNNNVKAKDDSSSDDMAFHDSDEDDHKTAEATLEEISKDNQTFRDSSTLQEKAFDIQLDEETWFEMRDNTKLVLVDIPGLNEARTQQKYKYYVAKNWDKFDCVVVVLDGRQGVNTEEQIDLLRFIEQQRQTNKDISVIVAFNKVDDPEDTEQSLLIKEARTEVERIFNIASTEQVMENILQGTQPRYSATSKSPVAITAMSAIHAFIYRSASRLSYDEFEQKIDPSLLDKLGKDSYGRRWNRFEKPEKIRKAYELIKDPEEFRDGIQASNYHYFSAALAHCVGGIETQNNLLQQQVTAEMSRLTHETDGLVAKLATIGFKLEKLGMSSEETNEKIFRKFVELQNESIQTVFQEFEKPQDVHILAKPMKQLYLFALHCKTLETWPSQRPQIIALAKKMVLMQIADYLTFDHIFMDHPLTSSDFVMMYGSILNVANQPWFGQHFGTAKILLDRKFQIASQGSSRPPQGHSGNQRRFRYTECWKCKKVLTKKSYKHEQPFCCGIFHATIEDFDPQKNSFSCCKCKRQILRSNVGGFGGDHTKRDFCNVCNVSHSIDWNRDDLLDPLMFQYSEEENDLVPCFPIAHEKHVHLKVSSSFSDPDHFGHLIWMFGRILQIDKGSNDSSFATQELETKPVPESAQTEVCPNSTPTDNTFNFGFKTAKSESRALRRKNSPSTAAPTFSFGAPSPAPAPTTTGRGFTFGAPAPAPAPTTTVQGGFVYGGAFGDTGSGQFTFGNN